MRKMKLWGFVFAIMILVLPLGFISFPVKAEEGDVEINITNFPDKNFRNYISSEFDLNGDDILQSSEIKKVEGIFLGGFSGCEKISDLKGIEYFTELRELWMSGNSLRKLDVSNNTKLQELHCGNSYITKLDFRNNTELRFFECAGNYTQLELDVSQNKKLEVLKCNDNKMSKLDVSNNTELKTLICDNNKIKELDISHNTKLINLNCDMNQLTKLDVSKQKKLVELACSLNQIDKLDLSNNTELKTLGCASNKITNLDISNNPKVIEIYKNYDTKSESKTSYFYFINHPEYRYFSFDKTTNIIEKHLQPLAISLSNVDGGVKITWKAESEAEKYRIYKKNAQGSWVKLTTVTALKYTDSSVQPGENCTYSILALSSDGKELNSYGNGKSIVCSKPVMVNADYKPTGVALSWSKVDSSAKYRIFRKTGNGDWTKLATTTSLSYVDKTAVYGKNYTYAVRAMSSAGSFISDMGNGTNITYQAPVPKVTLENGTLGVNIRWTSMSGAAKYRIFVKNSNGIWTKLATVKEGTVFTDTAAKVGKSYTYAVVGMDSAGRLMNDYGKGMTIKREKPILNFALKSVASGVKVTWKAADGAGKYRVYRKNVDGDWDMFVTVKNGELYYRDTTAMDGMTYTYAVVALTAGGGILTERGEGQNITYVKPVSESQVLEAEVTDENGNTVVIIADGDEISMDIIDAVPEDNEEVSEEEDIAEREDATDIVVEDEGVIVEENSSNGENSLEEDINDLEKNEETVSEEAESDEEVNE